MAANEMRSVSARQTPRYVQVSDPPPDLACFPDFLIVGPQRTGTTWLHAHLRYHPQIMLSEPKELYFFSSLTPSDKPRCPSRELGWYLECFREPLQRVLLRHAISLWRFREWYRPAVRGEATASYAALDREVIEDIVLFKPDIKVILMIRDPIERAWSHAKKDLVRNRGRQFADVAPREFEQFFADPYQRRCARYAENIDTWAACLRPGHLLVALFDDIATRPQALLLEVMAFLGVTADARYLSGEVDAPVNPTGVSSVPDRYRQFLAELLRDDVAQLETRLGLSWSSGAAGSTLRRTAAPLAAARGRVVFALADRADPPAHGRDQLRL